MINKIISFSILFSCFLALFLSFSGVSAPVWFGEQFRSFIVATNKDLSEFHIEIPNIPFIPQMDLLSLDGAWYEILLKVAVNFVQLWVRFINGLISLLNFIILALNTIIQLLQFILLFLKNIIIMRDNIVSM